MVRASFLQPQLVELYRENPAMSPFYHRPDRYGVVMTVVIALSVWTINSLGLLAFSDNYLGDLANACSATNYAPSKVLLVYTPASTLADDEKLTRLVNRINVDQPAKIAIVHHVSSSKAKRLGGLECASKIVIGYRRDKVATEPFDAPVAHGYLDLCLEGQAVYRDHQFKSTRRNGQGQFKTDWSIEAVIAKQVIAPSTILSIPSHKVGVRFFGGASGLPNVTSSDLLGNQVISEMVSDRIVMIGTPSANDTGFVTPTSVGSGRMSRLELHANFLQTLLHQNYLVSPSETGMLFVILAVPLVCVHFFRNLATRWLIRSFVVLLAFVFIFCWNCLTIWSVRLPVTAMTVAVVLSFVSVLYLRFLALKELVENWRLLRSSTQRIKLRHLDGDRWEAVADSVEEIFQPTRLVLMKLDVGATHLKVAVQRNCDASEIVEQRRDVHRYPFRKAIDQNFPTHIEDRRFLKESPDVTLREYMVPLVMLSEIVGFMVVEMDETVLERWGDFESCLSRYANEMAIFLAGNGDDQEIQDSTGFIRQASHALPEQAMASSLIKDEIQHRSFGNMLDSTVNGAETAIAIGDVFGQLVKVNEKMIALLQRDDVSAQDASCVEVLARLTQRGEDECRKLFRRCMIEDRSEQIVLASKSADESPNVLFIRPLSRPDTDRNGGMDSRFVAIEIVSGEIFDAINHWQRQFLVAQSEQIDRQMNLLLQIAGDLEIVKRDGGSQTDPYVAVARDVLRCVNECRNAVGYNLTDSPQDHFLLDVQPILSAALKSSDVALTQHGVSVRKLFAKGEQLVNANPFLLEQVFATIVDCLITDCDEETQLVIASEATDDEVTIHFNTQSDQIETSQLERCLFGASETDRQLLKPSEEALVTQRHLDRLHESSRWLRQWGAKLSIDCDAFYRVSISLTLMTTDHALVDDDSANSCKISLQDELMSSSTSLESVSLEARER